MSQTGRRHGGAGAGGKAWVTGALVSTVPDDLLDGGIPFRTTAQGPLVKFTSQLLRRIFPSGVENGQVEMRIRVIGIQGDGRAELRFSLGTPTFLTGNEADVIVGIGVVHIIPHALAEGLQGFVQLTLLVLHHAQVVVGGGIGGAMGQSPLQELVSVVVFPLANADDTEVAEGVDIPPIQRQDFFIAFFNAFRGSAATVSVSFEAVA